MNYSEQLKSPLWQRKRLKIMERDNFQCKVCESKSKQLTVHHFQYKSNAMAWDYENSMLITLCNDCHKKTHEIQNTFAVDFMRFTPNCMKSMIDNEEYIKDCGLAFLENYKDITAAMYSYIEYGTLVFDGINENRTFVFQDIEFDEANGLIWVNSFWDAKN
jgi:hypothetical protein